MHAYEMQLAAHSFRQLNYPKVIEANPMCRIARAIIALKTYLIVAWRGKLAGRRRLKVSFEALAVLSGPLFAVDNEPQLDGLARRWLKPRDD